jgi:D-threo-aldose 1-dehydrogenase
MYKATDITLIGNQVPITRLGFGVATQGGLFHAVTELEANTVFQAAWDAGIRYFDTAPWYGFGSSERRIGAFLQGKHRFCLSSKVGRLLSKEFPVHPTQMQADGTKWFDSPSLMNVKYDYSYDGTMRSLEDSLARMQLPKLDIALIHDPDAVGASVQDVLTGCAKALFELRDQGVIGAVGAGMNQWQMPFELAQAASFDVFLLAGRYTLLEQESLPFMNYCAQNNIRILIGGVYNSGLLANPNPEAIYNYQTVPKPLLTRALALQSLCENHGVPLRAAALQFPFRHEAVASVLIAARNVMQLEDNLRMFEVSIPPELWQDLIAAGLLEENL